MKGTHYRKTILANLELYITILVAIGLSILSLVGYSPPSWVNSVTLAALGVLTYAALRSRHRSNSTITEIKERSKKTIDEIKKISVQTSCVWEKIVLSDVIRNTGLIDIKSQSREINWDLLFNNVMEIDLFFTYARTWRNSVENLLYDFLKQDGARLRVILPDPYNKVVIKELSNRFSKTEKEFEDLIIDATKQYDSMSLFGKKNYGAKVEVWHTSVTPMYSIYRFDKTAIISLSSYKSYKGDVPHFLADRRGALYKFAYEELETLLNNNGRDLSSKIIPPKK